MKAAGSIRPASRATRSGRRIAVLSPRETGGVLNAETRALVEALAQYDVDISVFELWSTRREGFKELLRNRYDAVYSVVGAELVEGPERWNLDVLELLTSPLLYRLADPPFSRRFLLGLQQAGPSVVISCRDFDCAEYLHRAGIAPAGVHYTPGRFDDSRIDPTAASVPLSARDIPFLFVGSVFGTEEREAYIRSVLPDRIELLRVLSDALLAEASRPTWEVAENVYASLDDGLTPFRGIGRAVLEQANRHANARFRQNLVERLAKHDGVLVLDGGAALAETVRSEARAKMLGRQSHDDIVKLTQRSRVVIAVPPHFCVGAVSERVYWSMAAGALSLALRTPAMDRHFEAGRHYHPFDRMLDGIEATLAAARDRPDDLQPVVDEARRHVRTEFSSVPNVKTLFAPLLDLGEPRASRTR